LSDYKPKAIYQDSADVIIITLVSYNNLSR